MHPDHILARIVQRKHEELLSHSVPLPELEEQARGQTRRSFRNALTGRKPAIIAEIKKASPSRGLLAENFEPARIARQYEEGGAAALSVLTDRDFFQGDLRDLQAARNATDLPVLRKDFTVAEYQIVEAAAYGADAILLIAAILDVHELRAFRECAASYRMDTLVEVHDEGELERAVESGADIIGVNNRDLRTFAVSLEVARRLAPLIPEGAVRVAESGIFSREDIQLLHEYDAFLVGESLMRASDPADALLALCS